MSTDTDPRQQLYSAHDVNILLGDMTTMRDGVTYYTIIDQVVAMAREIVLPRNKDLLEKLLKDDNGIMVHYKDVPSWATEDPGIRTLAELTRGDGEGVLELIRQGLKEQDVVRRILHVPGTHRDCPGNDLTAELLSKGVEPYTSLDAGMALCGKHQTDVAGRPYHEAYRRHLVLGARSGLLDTNEAYEELNELLEGDLGNAGPDTLEILFQLLQDDVPVAQAAQMAQALS